MQKTKPDHQQAQTAEEILDEEFIKITGMNAEHGNLNTLQLRTVLKAMEKHASQQQVQQENKWIREIMKLNFYGWKKDGMKENPNDVPQEDVFVLREDVLNTITTNK